jgi:NADH-quinone oxidoreductase subunit E
MLTIEERQEIEAELAHYPNKQAVCIEAMRIVQRHRGWVSDESLHDLSKLLEMTTDELDGVASFYNLIFRKPVGKHVILLCSSITCWIFGCDHLREHLINHLGIQPGETTPDGEFTLLPIVCLGACDTAPVMMVDGALYHDLNPEKMMDILGNYKQGLR